MNQASVLFYCRRIILALCGLCFFGIPALAETCKEPTPDKLAELSSYLAKRYHYGPMAQISLVESVQGNEACYWKLRYKVTQPKAEVTVYLSPDGKYLMPTLYDLQVDPLIEERARAAQLLKTLTAGDPPSLGNPEAAITIVEFSDFQCPYCKKFTDVLENDLTPAERKNSRVIFRQFPLAMHPGPKQAAEMAGCADLESDAAFWKLHDYLFANQQTMTTDSVHDKIVSFLNADASFDQAQFQKCLDKKLSTGGVAQDMDMGTKNGVRATPTLFINGTKYEGMKDATQLRAILSDIQKSQEARLSISEPKNVTAK